MKKVSLNCELIMLFCSFSVFVLIGYLRGFCFVCFVMHCNLFSVEKNQMFFIETSALDATNVDEAFNYILEGW